VLLEDTDYPLTAVCLEDTLTCGFTKQDFEKLVLDYRSIGLPTHEELGFLVGAHRVSITRAIKALKESGKIIQEGRTLILALGSGHIS
jgi:CRP/FNR family transcriptional regulator, cyclic AMP receptor protein